jgi:hypothetical protein
VEHIIFKTGLDFFPVLSKSILAVFPISHALLSFQSSG